MGASGAGEGFGTGAALFVLGLALASLLAISLGALVLFVRRRTAVAGLDVDERFSGADTLFRDDNANFFGALSRGAWGVRGNGILVLTDSELYFRLLVPSMEISIPLRSVVAVETTNSFLGKSIFRPLLKVVFTDSNGKEDAVAWFVRDLDALKASLDALGVPRRSE